MAINNNTKNYHKNPSFQKLNLNQESLYNANRNIFEGIRIALTPQDGKLLSDIHELAERCNVSISANSKESLLDEGLSLSVENGMDLRFDNLKTKDLSPTEIAKQSIKRLKDLYHNTKIDK